MIQWILQTNLSSSMSVFDEATQGVSEDDGKEIPQSLEYGAKSTHGSYRAVMQQIWIE